MARLSKSCVFLWAEKHFFIFSCEEKHFAELWIVVLYVTLEAVVEWCSAKLGVIQKAILKLNSSESLLKTSKKYMWRMFFSRVAGVNSATVLKNDFFYNYFSRI